MFNLPVPVQLQKYVLPPFLHKPFWHGCFLHWSNSVSQFTPVNPEMKMASNISIKNKNVNANIVVIVNMNGSWDPESSNGDSIIPIVS